MPFITIATLTLLAFGNGQIIIVPFGGAHVKEIGSSSSCTYFP